MDENLKCTECSTNFLDKIKEFVKQEKDYVLDKINVIEKAYREAFLTLQRVDEERTPDRAKSSI
jgi:hypothetical protein